MKDLLYGLIVGIIIYFIYFIIIINNKKRLKRFINNSRETNMIKNRFKLDYSLLDNKMVANYFAISNSFMIGLLYFIVSFINNYILKLLLAFISFSFLTIIIYLKIGKTLKKKEGLSCTITKK